MIFTFSTGTVVHLEGGLLYQCYVGKKKGSEYKKIPVVVVNNLQVVCLSQKSAPTIALLPPTVCNSHEC